MLKVWNCLETQHDWSLVLVAGLICLLTSLAAVNLYQRARVSDLRVSMFWLLTTGAVTGGGIWATHFIAMLAYTPGVAIDYDLKLTVASLLIAAVMTTLGFVVAAHGGRRWRVVVGGGLIGIGIAAMHYTGMASLNLLLSWDQATVISSIVAGIVLAIGAVALAQHGESSWNLAGAGVLLTLAITSHHFIAMGAIELLPAIDIATLSPRLSPVALCLTVALATSAIVGAGLFAALIDRSSHRRVTERTVQLDAALNNMGQGLCMYDDAGRLQLCNAQYIELYRLRAEDIVLGEDHERQIALKIAAGTMFLDADTHRSKLAAAIADRTPTDWMASLPDGREIHITYQPMSNGGWVITHEDYTERMQSRARIEFLAHHDGLTLLANRIAFDKQLAEATARAKAAQTSFAAICVDLDHFKAVNDVYGHIAGDEFLREVARRLTEAAADEFVARVGGDEFIILTAHGTRPEDAEALCERIVAAFAADFQLKGGVIRAGCSMGVAMFPDNGRTAEDLIANADAALYRVKADQRGSFRFFETSLDNSLREKRTLHRDLIEAVEKRQFEPYFQPQVTAFGEIVGFEVLVRWRHPTRGLVAPAEFIPLAEETGLITEIDEQVLRAACREGAGWDKPLAIAVNLSPVDFKRGDVPSTLLSILFETGMEPDRLHIEITEGVLMQDDGRAIGQLRRIKDLGAHLAMDDFGTGYSSLSYLQSFPFDKIKIDRGFVAQLVSNPQSRAIVKAIIGLGHSLGLSVIAEGVEQDDQLDFLIELGCDEFQGYLTGRPQPAKQYRVWTNDEPGAAADEAMARSN
ncbi:EAL domain-containing protein [Rhodopseudomonas palustris]|uniref:bifunctional diguanylate cyclase/phosphodiesterase n=1 Tax=Rhodopseudomonas palustris TaxID=1076 RepID=UPI0020CFE50A|nr:EAL domain-containing protein [Rhodopseudomonas palustris]MCP9625994.1 EAL domain-containing protein [Rhodopseudomonas palustris]